MGGMMMRGVSRCILNLYAACCYPSLNPKIKSQAMTLRANKLKPSIGSGIQRSYCHSKKVGVGPGALARRIRDNNARKAAIAQLREWEHRPGLQGRHGLRGG
jgi:hypothetical protein